MEITDQFIVDVAFDLLATREKYGFPPSVLIKDVYIAVERKARSLTPCGVSYPTVSYGTLVNVMNREFVHDGDGLNAKYTI